MNPPPSIDVEKAFGNFVKSFRGSLVSEIVGDSPPFANADYLFRDRGVVAELKCIKKDVLADTNCQIEIGHALDKWIIARKIPPFWGTARIQMAKLPPDCQRKLFQILRKPIRGAIKKANRQIRETKANLNLPDAKGLLLLVNDGCWSIESDAMLHLVDISFCNHFTSVNSVVYFTVNMQARMPGVERAVLVWIRAGRKDIEPVDKNFLAQLQKGWCAYYESLIGESVPTFEFEGRQRIQDLRFIGQTPPPQKSSTSKLVQPVTEFGVGKYYSDSLGRRFRCLNLHDDSVTLMRFEIYHQGKTLDVVFTQNVKYAFHYTPMADLAEIRRLEARYQRRTSRRE